MQKELAHQLEKYLEKHQLSQVEFGQVAKVSQPVVSRILNGEWQRTTPSIVKIANLIDVNVITEVDPRKSKRLMKALGKVWDGSHRSEVALAKIIEGVGHLI